MTMQDRFKFRVWDKRLNRYLGKDDPTQMLLDNGNLAYLNDEGMKFYEVEQCTGLKDKNGKLIYEGDIIKQGNRIYKVIFSYDDVASCGCCVDKFSGCGFVMEDKYGCRGDLDIYSELEVIGNIHENGDLLENKDE